MIAFPWKLDIERGPNWLWIKVAEPLRKSPDASALGGELRFLLEEHLTYRLVLDLNGVSTLCSALIDELVKLDTGQFTHLFWDVNESFGTFTQFVDRGQDPVEIDPFWLPVGIPMGPPGTPVEDQPRPLAENLWAIDEYSTEYLRDLAEMLREGFDLTSATARINELADLIRDDVAADPNKQFTTAQFEQNLTTNVNAGMRTIYGLTSFIEDRAEYLSSVLDSYAEQSDLALNELMSVNVTTAQDQAGDFDPWVEIYNNGPGSVSLSGLYLTDSASELTKWAIPTGNLTDGDFLTIWVDGETSEGSNHASFALSASGGEVYLTNGTTVIDGPAPPLRMGTQLRNGEARLR